MTGLELARAYWEATMPALLEGLDPQVRAVAAFGLVGAGSECLGFDDGLSRDHDFGPGYCVWLPSWAHARWGRKLQARYDALPAEFLGLSRRATPLAGKRVGVFETGAFYRAFIGLGRAPETPMEWLRVPEQLMATAVSGEVFADPMGEFSSIRLALQGFYPEPVVRKKMAADLASMAQAGQYNLPRCLRRGDPVAANAARAEFLSSLVAALHLLSRTYMPFYKWAYRSLGSHARTAASLVGLVGKMARAPVAEVSQADVELACGVVRRAVLALGWARTSSDFLLDVAREVQDGIDDELLRGLPIGEGGVR